MAERYFPIIPSDKLFVNEKLRPWIEAFEAIDSPRSNKGPLVELLRANVRMPWPAPWHLADLLERYDLKRPRGNQKEVASYDYSEAWAKLIRGKQYFKHYKNQMTRDDAIRKAAQKVGIKVGTLRNYIDGRNTSTRRLAKRRPPPDPGRNPRR